jgi:hypothetical protein
MNRYSCLLFCPPSLDPLLFLFRVAANQARLYNFLNEKGVPMGLAGLPVLLYNEEPGNLALTATLLSGAIEKYLNRPLHENEMIPTDRIYTDEEVHSNLFFFSFSSTKTVVFRFLCFNFAVLSL